jgi:hypothetical protein
MAARSRVFARVVIRRRITAQGHSTLLTCAKVYPLRSHFDALLALSAFRLFDVCDGPDV